MQRSTFPVLSRSSICFTPVSTFGCGPAHPSRRHTAPEEMDTPPSAEARWRQDRKAGSVPARYRCIHVSGRGSHPHRDGLLRAQRRANALSRVPPTTPVYRLRCNRSRLQDGDRRQTQTVRHVLDGAWRKCDHRPALLPPQQPDGRLLGITTRCLIFHFYVAHPVELRGVRRAQEAFFDKALSADSSLSARM